MIEAPQHIGFGDIKEVVKQRRFIKELADEEEITLGGAKGQRLEGILDRTDQVLSELEVEHADWIEQKRQLLASYLSPVKPLVVEETYRGGLATTITQEFRTYGHFSKDETVKLDDPEYLRRVITGYTVDFLRSLRISERLGINPNVALDIARLSYRYNPTKLIQLIRNPEFEGLTPGTIEHAALHNPKNPEAFLRGFIKTVAELGANPEFGGLTPGSIEHAALNYKNPEAFLRGFIKTVAELGANPEFEGLMTPGTIEHAALHYKNPEAFLRGFIKTVAELGANPEFEGLMTPGTIEHAALHNPKNPEAFLRGFIKTVAELTAKYSNLAESIIIRAALHFPGNPEAYIKNVVAGKIPAETLEAE